MQTAFLSLAILMTVAAAVEAAPPAPSSAPLQWKEYVYPADRFAITLPEAPKPHPDKGVPSGTAYTVHLPTGLGVTLRVGNYPKGCSAFFANYQDAMRKAAKAVQDGAYDWSKWGAPPLLKETSVAGYPAVEQEHNTKPNGKYYDRVQCAGTKLYLLIAAWSPSSKRPPELDRIANSFRVLPR